MFGQLGDSDLWDATQDAKFLGKGQPFTRREWDALLGAHSGVSADAPAVGFAEELVAVYPEAKVLLIERDIETWYRSFDRAVISALFARVPNLVADWDVSFTGRLRGTYHRWAAGHLRATNAEEMRRNARDVYREHYAMVRRVTPPERLLEFQLSEGWAPLCKFLGKEVPDEPFPRVNDEAAL